MKPLIFRSEGDKFDAILDVPDESGAVVFSARTFTGGLGAR